MKKKNQAWLKEMHKREYNNQRYLEEYSRKKNLVMYGLEAESISDSRIEFELDNLLKDLIGKDDKTLKIFQLRRLQESIKKLILSKIT